MHKQDDHKASERGFATIVVLVVVLVLMGAIFAFFWQRQHKSAVNTAQSSTTTQPTGSSKSPSADANVETKTLTLNSYKVAYPLNANNQNVIVETEGDHSRISYKPVRNYYASLAGASADCKNWTEGQLEVGTIDQLFPPADPRAGGLTTTDQKTQKVNELIAQGKAAKAGDIYILAPAKQNEPCTDIYDSNEPALKSALKTTQDIETSWLRSMTVTR